jgi:hypothetical protein
MADTVLLDSLRRAAASNSIDEWNRLVRGATPDHLYTQGVGDLRGADLAGLNLYGAVLFGAQLQGANLSGADLWAADLGSAWLDGADMSNASLVLVNFQFTSLRHADLTGAELAHAHFLASKLEGTVLRQCWVRNTVFSAVDLSSCDIDNVHVREPCSVDTHTLELTAKGLVDARHRVPEVRRFLANCGVAPQFLDAFDTWIAYPDRLANIMQSTFISYGHPDEAFARRLHEELQRHGVRTFFFPEHAEPGERIHRVMRKGVNQFDRVILICSRQSLDRPGVLNEIEEVLAREARDGGASYLIPVRLDDYVFSGWSPPQAGVAQALRDRVVANFELADRDQQRFEQAIEKLLAVLTRKRG